MTMDTLNAQKTMRASSFNVKLSPDCVGTANLDTTPTLLLEKFRPSSNGNHNQELIVQNLHGPFHSDNILHLQTLPPLKMPGPRGPPIPPPTRIASSQLRSVSESESSTARKGRRAIFGKYWGHNESPLSTKKALQGDSVLKSSTESLSAPERRMRQRSSSLSILDSPGIKPISDYRMYAPSKATIDNSTVCHRFSSVQSVPALETLPPFPAPLRRLCPESRTAHGQGMYPMVTPIPILRQSSYRSFFAENRPSSSAKKMVAVKESGSFNLTKSIGPRDKASFSFDAESTSASSSSDFSSMKGSGVRFDPRVTVTEYEDPIERQWYTENELDRLRQETIVLAQEYLITNPVEAEKYSRARLDPVTGSYRKKALFSLPILASILGDALPAPDCSKYQKLIRSQVKKILVVDPNKSILRLFCKSMASMFPDAVIEATGNGEDALTMVSQELEKGVNKESCPPRNFDIIIVEQRLYQPVQEKTCSDSGNSKLAQNSSCLNISEMKGREVSSFLPLRKPNSFIDQSSAGSKARVGVCGSDFLQAIQRLEQHQFGRVCRHEATPSRSPREVAAAILPCKALLIGVSMQPDRDAKLLKGAGADVIWGKPIPSVGNALRNQLLNALIYKRRCASRDA